MARDQVSPVAHVSANVPAVGITTTFPTQPQAGAMCVVPVWGANPGAITVTDNAGNVYTQDAISAGNASAPACALFRTNAIVLAANFAVTIKAANAGAALVGFAETIVGSWSGPAEDTGAYNGTTNVNVTCGPRGISNNDFYFAIVACDGSLAANNMTTETDLFPWTTQGVEQNGVLYDNGIGADLFNSGPVSYDCTFQASGANWNGLIAAYKDPVSGVRPLWWPL